MTDLSLAAPREGTRVKIKSRLRGWLARCRWRGNQLIASEAFQRRAMRLPGGRFIGRRKARRLFDLCSGFTYSQVLYACVKLELFEKLREGPVVLADLVISTGLECSYLERLLAAAQALDLCLRHDDQIGLGSQGAALLGNDGVRAMIEHHPLLYRDLVDPLSLLAPDADRPTNLADFWSYAGSQGTEPGDAATRQFPADAGFKPNQDYSQLMSRSQKFISVQLLAAYDFAAHEKILDVGGGQGAFARSLLQRHRNICVTLFDLPAVVPRSGETDRLQVVPGNFFESELPEGADLLTLVRIVHDHDLPEVRRLLAACHRAVASGGRLMIAEPMAGDHGAGGVEAYFGCYFLAMGQGRLRSFAELRGLVEAAGFRHVTEVPVQIPMLVRVLVAEKP
jgi:demethylspheroidene O-methyltransferase